MSYKRYAKSFNLGALFQMNFASFRKMPILFLLLILSPLFPAETSLPNPLFSLSSFKTVFSLHRASLCPKHQHQEVPPGPLPGSTLEQITLEAGVDWGAARSFCLLCRFSSEPSPEQCQPGQDADSIFPKGTGQCPPLTSPGTQFSSPSMSSINPQEDPELHSSN